MRVVSVECGVVMRGDDRWSGVVSVLEAFICLYVMFIWLVTYVHAYVYI